MLAMVAIAVAQFFRLEDDLNVHGFGLYRASKGLAGMLLGSAIAILLTGAYRFWKQQNAMVRGKIWAAGWELHFVGVLMIAVSVLSFR